MRIHLKFFLCGLGTVAALTANPAARAAVVEVPNFSFETPEIVDNPFHAVSSFNSWQKSAIPAYNQSSGTFENIDSDDDDGDGDTDPLDIDNLDGAQGAFFFSAPFNEIYQDLTATYQVGSSYQLKVAAEGGGANMALNEPLLMQFYYRDLSILVGDNRVVIGTTTILNDNPPVENFVITHLDDWTLNIPVVLSKNINPWAGEPIGIRLLAPQNANGGYWDLDNVRLVAVPEPASLSLLAVAGAIVMRRRRR